MFELSRVCVRSYSSGDLGVALARWPNHFILLHWTVWLMDAHMHVLDIYYARSHYSYVVS